MPLDSLYPISGNNAIQNASFALEWQGELTSTEITEVVSKVNAALKHDFPFDGPQTVQKISFVNNQIENQRLIPTFEIGGHLFEKRSSHSNSTSRAISFNVSSLVISINEYTRWESVWQDVKRYLELFLPSISKPIHSIGLQYADIFIWRDDPNNLDLNLVFRKDTKFLTPNSLDSKSLWHSHHGYIKRLEQPAPNNRLDNINVNLIDDNGTRALQIVTSHRTTPDTQIWVKQENPAAASTLISEFFSEMHLENKTIMHELLSDEVCKKIKLTV